MRWFENQRIQVFRIYFYPEIHTLPNYFCSGYKGRDK